MSKSWTDQSQSRMRILGRKGSFALFGAPGDCGGPKSGAGEGIAALRNAGLVDMLELNGVLRSDLGDLIGPAYVADVPRNGYRHLGSVVTWVRRVRDIAIEAFATDAVPLMLGGDHSISIGTLAAASARAAVLDRPLYVIWVDAHADFNVAQTSPSGNLHGMPLAVATGTGPSELTDLWGDNPFILSQNLVIYGGRSIDEGEARRLAEGDATVVKREEVANRGVAATLLPILEKIRAADGLLHLSFDTDVLDPIIAPGTGVPVADGFSFEEARQTLKLLARSGLVSSVDFVETDPTVDQNGKTVAVILDLIGCFTSEGTPAGELARMDAFQAGTIK